MSGPGGYRPDDEGYRGVPDGRPGPAPGPDELPQVYNPYAGVSYPSSYPVPPAGLGPVQPAGPVRRPGTLHLALLLLLVSTVPYVVTGLLMVLGAEQVAALAPAEQLEQLRAAGLDAARVVRIAGGVVLAVVLVFALLGVLAWSGRRWARALVAAMTVGFALMAAVVLVGAAGQGGAGGAGSLLVVVGPAVLAAVGVVLMFAPAARAWFARPRP